VSGCPGSDEGAVVAEPACVLSRSDEEGTGSIGADTDLGHESGDGGDDEWHQDLVEASDFGVELKYRARQSVQGQMRDGREVRCGERDGTPRPGAPAWGS